MVDVALMLFSDSDLFHEIIQASSLLSFIYILAAGGLWFTDS